MPIRGSPRAHAFSGPRRIAGNSRRSPSKRNRGAGVISYHTSSTSYLHYPLRLSLVIMKSQRNGTHSVLLNVGSFLTSQNCCLISSSAYCRIQEVRSLTARPRRSSLCNFCDFNYSVSGTAGIQEVYDPEHLIVGASHSKTAKKLIDSVVNPTQRIGNGLIIRQILGKVCFEFYYFLVFFESPNCIEEYCWSKDAE